MRWMIAVILFSAVAASAGDDNGTAPSPAPPPAAAAQPTPAITTPPAPDCRLRRKALLDMEMDDTGRITVPVSINGANKRMMLDTGATDSLIAQEVVDDLKLPSRPAPNGSYMVGFGGRIEAKVVDIAEFGFGQLRGKNFTLFVMSGGFDSAGLLGGDFLFFFDLDFDFANAKLSLMSPDHCPGNVVYWSNGNYGVVPFELESNHIKLKVTLDGEEVNAVLDTGAADTVMSLDRAAGVFDIDRDKLKKSRHYPFKNLAFGEVNVANPAIELILDEESKVMGRNSSSLHMILGMGVLRRMHLYISYKEKKIYVTPATQY